jgi:mRNA-degrading endonuclease RelE of RelBE toxin-antitoxin system
LKQALRELQRERGDIQPLEQALTGYCRLRVGRFRVIFRYRDAKTIDALFAEERGIVYEVFEQQFLRKLKA